MRDIEWLVISGYGFGDKGINSYITNWIYNVFPRRLIVIHPDPGALAQDARGAIAAKWSSWQSSDVLRTIAHTAEDVSWAELLRAIAT